MRGVGLIDKQDENSKVHDIWLFHILLEFKWTNLILSLSCADLQCCFGIEVTSHRLAFMFPNDLGFLFNLFGLIFFYSSHATLIQEHNTSCYLTFLFSFFLIFKFLLLFNYSCLLFLPIPPPHPSRTRLPPPPWFCPCVLSLFLSLFLSLSSFIQEHLFFLQ